MISDFTSTVTITGDFTVDTALFTFDGAEVGFKVGCTIHVLTGNTLRIINGSILTNLGAEMWGGIVVDTGATVEVIGSTLCGAETAISIDNGFTTNPGSFLIENSLFSKNYIGLSVRNYSAGTYPGYVIGTHFEGGALPSKLCTGLPVLTSASYKGIDISQVSGGTGLTIGDATTAPAVANRFTDMDFGIYSLSSTVRVFNNAFEDIQDLAGLNQGYAVYALVNPPGPYELIVGTSSTRANTFTDCRFGVYSTGMQIVNVSDNTMSAGTAPFEVGVEINRTSDTIIVAGNTILDFTQTGVILDDNPGPGGGAVDASVNSNRIEGTFEETVGVWVNVLEGGVNVRVNEISQVFRGIVAQSLASASQVRIDTNQIEYGYAGVSMQAAAGILALDVATPQIYKNRISGNCPYPGGGGPCDVISLNNTRIRGIVLYRTTEAKVYLNYVEHGGAGMYILRDNLEGNAVCNEFHDSYSGVVWDNLGTGEFGESFGSTYRVHGLFLPPDKSSDNRWTSTVGGGFEPIRSFSINGSQAGSIDWYYRDAMTYDFPSAAINLDDGSPGVSILSPLIGDSTNVCFILATNREAFEQVEEGMEGLSGAREEAVDQALMLGSGTALSRSLYHYLRLAYKYPEQDAHVQTLLGWTAIASLDSIRGAWQQGDIVGAKEMVERLPVSNHEENLLKATWSTRIQRELDTTRTNWLPEEQELLDNIAYSDFGEAGSAAIFAQSLLGITWLPDEWHVDDQEERILKNEVSKVSIVPNPAVNTIYLLNAGEYQTIVITDIQSKTWLSQPLSGQAYQSIQVGTLPNGMYIVQLVHPTGETTSLKLLIQR